MAGALSSELDFQTFSEKHKQIRHVAGDRKNPGKTRSLVLAFLIFVFQKHGFGRTQHITPSQERTKPIDLRETLLKKERTRIIDLLGLAIQKHFRRLVGTSGYKLLVCNKLSVFFKQI